MAAMKGTITNTKGQEKVSGAASIACSPLLHSILTLIAAGKQKRAVLFPSEHIILTAHFPAQTQS